MICPKERAGEVEPEHMVDTVLREFSTQEITLRLVSDPSEEARWNKLVRKHHYLKEDRLVGESLRYFAERNGQWIALLGWSSAAFHLHPRDKWIGWTDGQRHARRHLVACNARFVILPGAPKVPHLASRLLGLNVRRLSEDWLDSYNHPILMVETFVDPERFEGTCYRASNWTELGLTQGYKRTRLDFYQLHAQPKSIFVLPIHPQATSLLSAPILPSPWDVFEHRPSPSTFPLTAGQSRSLLEALEKLPDPRRFGGKRHRRVASIVAIAVTAMIAGNNTLLAIGEFAASLSQRHLGALGATRARHRREFVAPSESTIRRTLQRLDPDVLDEVITQWLRSHLKDLHLSVLAVDGKCARTASKINGQSITLFAALDTQTRQVCQQIQIPSKTNEIPALKDLLAELDLRKTLVTIDALHTQKETARHLVEDKQADYLLPVKDNQPKLFNKLTELARTGDFFPSGSHFGPEPRAA